MVSDGSGLSGGRKEAQLASQSKALVCKLTVWRAKMLASVIERKVVATLETKSEKEREGGPGFCSMSPQRRSKKRLQNAVIGGGRKTGGGKKRKAGKCGMKWRDQVCGGVSR